MAKLAPIYRPGELDQRVEIQSESRTPDGAGGFTSSWVVDATVWAHVRPLRGSEREQADRTEANGGYMVIIRWRDGVTENKRLRWVDQDITMNIRFVQEQGARALYLPIECERGVAT